MEHYQAIKWERKTFWNRIFRRQMGRKQLKLDINKTGLFILNTKQVVWCIACLYVDTNEHLSFITYTHGGWLISTLIQRQTEFLKIYVQRKYDYCLVVIQNSNQTKNILINLWFFFHLHRKLTAACSKISKLKKMFLSSFKYFTVSTDTLKYVFYWLFARKEFLRKQ